MSPLTTRKGYLGHSLTWIPTAPRDYLFDTANNVKKAHIHIVIPLSICGDYVGDIKSAMNNFKLIQ